MYVRFLFNIGECKYLVSFWGYKKYTYSTSYTKGPKLRTHTWSLRFSGIKGYTGYTGYSVTRCAVVEGSGLSFTGLGGLGLKGSWLECLTALGCGVVRV